MRFLALALMLGCTSRAPTQMQAPGIIRQALSSVSDLTADAQLVRTGGERGEVIALSRAEDGVSFSGFIPADPGEYTLEVTFRGLPLMGTERIFLGRWISDAFVVSVGSASQPTFSRKVDTLGDGEGDPDGDGLGNLEELLWGSNPSIADSDGDGVIDGRDCDPSDAGNAFVIVETGSLLDCDGDGVNRPDAPNGQAGNDCNDGDPSISPNLEDDCNDPIDSDCNPSTCAVDDAIPPTISGFVPAAGSMVGCHVRFGATIEDDSGIAAAHVVASAPVDGMEAFIPLEVESGSQYVATYPFNDMIAGRGAFEGTFPVEIRATDGRGNTKVETVSYDFAFGVPVVTSMTPMMVGVQTSPFTVDVQATAPRGVDTIRLMSARKNQSGFFDTSLAVEVGRASGPVGSFNVDPTMFTDGEHLLFPVVSDAIGNQTGPSGIQTPIGGADGTEINAPYYCTGLIDLRIPARVLVVGGSTGYEPATMRDLIDEAMSLGAATDPAADLVSVIGFGVRPDGLVGLDDAASYSKRWQFAFLNPTTQRALTVSWYTPAFLGMNPVIDDDAGNVTSDIPIPNPQALLDSPAMVDAYHQAGCPALTGHDSDFVLFHVVSGQTVATVSSNSGGTWRGTATSPIVEVLSCN